MAVGRLPPTEPCTCKRTKSDVAGEKPKLPVCFLTNGGGVLEAAKAKELSAWLDVKVHENQACARSRAGQMQAAHMTRLRSIHVVISLQRPDMVAASRSCQQLLQ